MADLTRCATCAALTQPDDAKYHAADHAHTKNRFDALTRQNTQYLQDIATLKQKISGYEKQLEAHPISMDPETITISDAPEFDDLDTEDTTDTDDGSVDLPDLTTYTEPDYPPAIDRDDDDLEARIAAHTGTVPGITR